MVSKKRGSYWWNSTIYSWGLISRTLVGNKLVNDSDVVGAPFVGADPSTSSFSTEHLTSMDRAKTSPWWDEKHWSFGIWYSLYWSIYCTFNHKAQFYSRCVVKRYSYSPTASWYHWTGHHDNQDPTYKWRYTQCETWKQTRRINYYHLDVEYKFVRLTTK